MTTPINQYRQKLARRILVYNAILVGVLILYYILNGFDDREFSATITLILAVSAIYLGTLFKRLAQQMNPVPETQPTPQTPTSQPLNDSHRLVAWLVPLHFFLILLFLSLKAFTQITFQEMNLFLGIVEALFGAYMGQVLTALYIPSESPRS